MCTWVTLWLVASAPGYAKSKYVVGDKVQQTL